MIRLGIEINSIFVYGGSKPFIRLRPTTADVCNVIFVGAKIFTPFANCTFSQINATVVDSRKFRKLQ